MFGIVVGEDGVAEGGSEVGAALATLDDNLGDAGEGLGGMLAFADVDEAYGGSNEAGGV